MFLSLERVGNQINLMQIYKEIPDEDNGCVLVKVDNDVVSNALSKLLSQSKQIQIVGTEYKILTGSVRYFAGYIWKEQKKYLTNVVKVEDTNEEIDLKFYIPLSKSVYDYLVSYEYLGFTGLFVKYDVPYVAFICELEEPDSMKELKTDENLELEVYGNLSLQKLKSSIGSKVSSLNIFLLFRLATLNQELMSRGFIITDKNIYNVCIKIINMQDSDLISLLSEYNRIYEQLQQDEKLLTSYRQFVDDILSASSKDDINAMYNKAIVAA